MLSDQRSAHKTLDEQMFIMFPKSEQALACPLKGIWWKIVLNKIYSESTYSVYIRICTNHAHELKERQDDRDW